VVFDSSTQVLVAMHQEDMFSAEYVCNVCIEAGIPNVFAVKQGRQPKKSSADRPTEPVEEAVAPAPKSTNLAITFAEQGKQVYMNLVPDILSNSNGPVALIHAMHGGYNSSFFGEGTGDSVGQANLNYHNAVSYKELAEILFKSCETQQQTIECGRITVFLDACNQYTVAEQMLAHLDLLADSNRRKIVSYPMVCSLSQPLMKGAFGKFAEGCYGPRWFIHLPSEALKDQVVDVADLLVTRAFTHQYFDESIRDPKTIRPSSDSESDISDRQKADSRGLKEQWAESPAIFSPEPVNLREKVQKVIDDMNTKSDCVIPNLPADAKVPERTFIEIG
jgi:hypothetical protein